MKNSILFSTLAVGLMSLAGGTNVQAFELLDRMTLGGCGCEPACGYEVDTCCAPKRCRPRLLGHGLHHMFHHHGSCAPACGCDVVEPSCGCGVEPSCGVEVGCGCDPCAKRCRLFTGKHLRNFMSRCKSSCCEPACGCDVVEPSCGCGVEPSCGMEVSCGCDPCADPCGKRCGLFTGKHLRNFMSRCKASCCEPACGCDVVEPSCGCSY